MYDNVEDVPNTAVLLYRLQGKSLYCTKEQKKARCIYFKEKINIVNLFINKTCKIHAYFQQRIQKHSNSVVVNNINIKIKKTKTSL